MLTTPVFTSLFQSLTRGCSIVFTLHRFEDPAYGISGHPEKILRSQLEILRRKRHVVLPLADLLQGLNDGSLTNRSAIAFTVDDGYGDFARVGSRIFAAFDCPVTVFLPTAFLDGAEWLWWDRIEAALLATDRHMVSVEIAGQQLVYPLKGAAHRTFASLDLTARLKRVPNSVRLATIEQLIADCGCTLSPTPPPKYAPMSWDEVRTLGTAGVTYGPHTVTHPILPMVSDQQAAFELEMSWDRVKRCATNAIPVFSYPNGDYTPREQRLLARMELAAAVSNRPRYIRPRDLVTTENRFALPRFCHYDDKPHFVQIVSGLERAKENVRRSFGRSMSASSTVVRS